MATLAHLAHHLQTYGRSHRTLYALCIALFFWTVFDGTVTYVTPLLITQAGFSESMVGLIIGTSSIIGALFDVVLARIGARTTYRRYFFAMFALSFAYPLILGTATTAGLFLAAMAIWALYFNLQTFGKFDFVGRRLPERAHAGAFGLIEVFQSLGYVVAPLVVGLIVVDRVGPAAFGLMWLFLALAGIAYGVFLLIDRPPNDLVEEQPRRRRSLLAEFHLWQRLGQRFLPALAVLGLLDLMTALFWTVGPLFAEDTARLGQFGGVFVSAFEIPILLVGWFIGSLTIRYGKLPTAVVSSLLGSVVLTSLGFIGSPVLIVLVAFLAATFFSIALPAVNGLFADYVEAGHGEESEIEAIGDFATNIGFIVGPILAGVLADLIGSAATFSAIGALGTLLMVWLLIARPTNH